MKKVSAVFKIILIAALVSSLLIAPAAAGLNGTEVNLINDESGYKIIVPGFIDIRTEEVYGEEVSVLVMKTPVKDSSGRYPIFEIVTTDENAVSISSYPGIADEGQIGNFDEVFSEGRLVYAPKFAIGGDLKDISKDRIFVFDFVVFDEDDNVIESIANLYFIFDDDAEPSAPVEEPKAQEAVTVKPTRSKVIVDGKAVAFEAYNIDDYNYFKLRDLAMALNGSSKQFEVEWDGKNIYLTTNTAYTSVGNELAISENPAAKQAKPTESKIYLNGEEIQLTAYKIDGSNYFKLRDIGKIIDFDVVWDGNVNIDTSGSYKE